MAHVVRGLEGAGKLGVLRHPPVVQHPGDIPVHPKYRFPLLHDQHAVKAARHLFEAVRMRVVPEGAGIDGIELVGEGPAGPDRRLRHVRHAVHGVGQPEPVPVDRGVFVEAVVEHDPQPVALAHADFGPGHAAAVAPDRRFAVRLGDEADGRGRGPQPHFRHTRRPNPAEGGEREPRSRRCEKRAARHRWPGQSGHGGLAWNSGAPGTTRTCDLLLRRQTLYPTELRALAPRDHRCTAFAVNRNARPPRDKSPFNRDRRRRAQPAGRP